MFKSTSAAAAVFAAGLLMNFNGHAAQANAQDPGAQSKGTPAPEDRPEVHAPVFRIISVEVLRSTHGGTLDILRVRGLASSSGWEEAELVPLTRGTPADGMLDLVFVARAPSEAMEAQGFEEIEAILPLETSHPYKGVNVHSASDSVSLSQIMKTEG